MFQAGLFCQAISKKGLRQLDGDILFADQQEQLVDPLDRFLNRDRITEVADNDLYRVRKRTRLGLLAGQSLHFRSALTRCLNHLTTLPLEPVAKTFIAFSFRGTLPLFI